MPSLLLPTALRPGDTVAIAALSGALEAEESPLLEHGVREIERLGFVAQVSPLVDVDRSWWWAADRPVAVAAEFNRLLRDPDVRAVFALTGGRMTFSYLDLIDFDAVRADPKPVLGFSDLSPILFALHSRTGLAAIHGDLVTHGLGYWHELDEPRRSSQRDLYRRLLVEATPCGDLTGGTSWETWRSGRATGPLIGGLLNRLVRFQATPLAFEPARFDGAILFCEEVNASVPAFWNDLHTLRLSGALDRVAGIIVGPTATVDEPPDGPSLREAVLDVLGDRAIPVLGNVDIGHEPPDIPLPLGVSAEIDAGMRTIALVEPAVTERRS